MSNLKKAFDHGKAFIGFITCGYPDLATTEKVVIEMEKNGCDLIELGIPFSDPTAEGPVIMEADEKALQGGVDTKAILEFVPKLREKVSIPIVFMTYANVLYSYGIEAFAKKCSEIGIDGVILPDVPFEEADEFKPILNQYDVDFISFIAPTSEQRIATIAQEATGFLYVISSMGVTGVRSEITTDIGQIVKVIRENTTTPCAVGFGISTPEQAKQMAEVSDAVIVGSAIVRMIGEDPAAAPKKVGAYVKSMKDAIINI